MQDALYFQGYTVLRSLADMTLERKGFSFRFGSQDLLRSGQSKPKEIHGRPTCSLAV